MRQFYTDPIKIAILIKRRRNPVPKEGDTFGYLKFTGKFFYITDFKALLAIECICKCGSVRIVRLMSLENRRTASCGCLQREHSSASAIARKFRTPEETRFMKDSIGVLKSMISRCHDPSNRAFKHYGSRGIFVCDEWRNSVQSFRDWMNSSGYKKGLSIERINNNLGYDPSNCTWADDYQQARNKRNSSRITAWGETKTLAEWAEDQRCVVISNTIGTRLKKNLPPELAISKPSRRIPKG